MNQRIRDAAAKARDTLSGMIKGGAINPTNKKYQLDDQGDGPVANLQNAHGVTVTFPFSTAKDKWDEEQARELAERK